MSKEIDFLPEQIKTIRNLCDIGLILYDLKKKELMPTILEQIYVEAQAIVNEYCVVGERD